MLALRSGGLEKNYIGCTRKDTLQLLRSNVFRIHQLFFLSFLGGQTNGRGERFYDRNLSTANLELCCFVPWMVPC